MTLVIALMLIEAFDLSGWWVVLSVSVWIIRFMLKYGHQL